MFHASTESGEGYGFSACSMLVLWGSRVYMGPKVVYGYVCLRVHVTCATCVHRMGTIVAEMVSLCVSLGLLMAMGMCVLRVSGEPQDVLVSGE